MHTCIHAYVHTAYMHTCIHAYMHTCIHAYIHTYIHTDSSTNRVSTCRCRPLVPDSNQKALEECPGFTLAATRGLAQPGQHVRAELLPPVSVAHGRCCVESLPCAAAGQQARGPLPKTSGKTAYTYTQEHLEVKGVCGCLGHRCEEGVTKAFLEIFGKLGSMCSPFQSVLGENLQCKVCGTTKTTASQFWDIMLPVPRQAWDACKTFSSLVESIPEGRTARAGADAWAAHVRTAPCRWMGGACSVAGFFLGRRAVL